MNSAIAFEFNYDESRYEETGSSFTCNTWSKVNKHTYFCCEDECGEAAHVSGGRCDECFEAYIEELRRGHNPELAAYEDEPHQCHGEWVDDGWHDYRVCDDCDSPRCPQYRPAAAAEPAVDDKCVNCAVKRAVTFDDLCWPCSLQR
jgi:hypothetical protein